MDKQVFMQQVERHEMAHKALLLAVSGGSDSIALLHLFASVQEACDLKLGVVHIDHQLRETSLRDAIFVQDVCQTLDIPCFVETWREPATSNIEANARHFRYQTFKKLMQQERYDYLCTAHHADDQMETLIQKWWRGSHIWNMTGMETIQTYQGMPIYRPLLQTSKQELVDYLDAHHLTYVEDETNATLDYQRNRIRHFWIPKLKKENPNIIQSTMRQREQLCAENRLAQRLGKQIVALCQIDETHYNLAPLANIDDPTVVAWAFAQKWIEQFGVVWNQNYDKQLQQLLFQKEGSQSLALASNIRILREYQKLTVLKEEVLEPVSEEVYTLNVPQTLQLSADEWVTFQKEPGHIKMTEGWSVTQWMLPALNCVHIRSPQAGDKMAIAPEQHKKLNRLFIDEKIPKRKRLLQRVLVNDNDEILGVLPMRQSYLRYFEKTDKIHYITYYYRKG